MPLDTKDYQDAYTKQEKPVDWLSIDMGIAEDEEEFGWWNPMATYDTGD